MNKQNWFIVLCVSLRDRAILIREKIYAITLTNRIVWYSAPSKNKEMGTTLTEALAVR